MGEVNAKRSEPERDTELRLAKTISEEAQYHSPGHFVQWRDLEPVDQAAFLRLARETLEVARRVTPAGPPAPSP